MGYCNTTTDLQRVCSTIENYQGQRITRDFTSAGSGVYWKEGLGFISNVFEDGTQLTKATSTPSAGEFYYNEDIDKLYINLAASDDPADHTVTVGEDWDALKESKLNEAMEWIDGYLTSKYVTPLIPRTRQTHTDNDYDYIIVRLTALVTCWMLISRVDPLDDLGISLFKEAYNSNLDTGEEKGIINQLLDGDIVLTDQITSSNVGSANIYNCSDNSTTATPYIFGTYVGVDYQEWKVTIEIDGAPGTATYKLSTDGGTTYSMTGQATKKDSQVRMNLRDGLQIYFPDVTYTAGDCWEIVVFPLSDTPTNTGVYSVTVSR